MTGYMPVRLVSRGDVIGGTTRFLLFSAKDLFANDAAKLNA
jgi:hypothetical protein